MVTMGHTFARRLRVARERHYPSAQQFAHAIGMHPHAYRKYERGESWPPVETLAHICQELEVSPNDLLWRKSKKNGCEKNC